MSITEGMVDAALFAYLESTEDNGRNRMRAALTAALPLCEQDTGDEVDTLTLSRESMESVGTSIQNAAHGVDFLLPEYVVIAITENLIASTWLRDRIDAAALDRATRAEAALAAVEALADGWRCECVWPEPATSSDPCMDSHYGDAIRAAIAQPETEET